MNKKIIALLLVVALASTGAVFAKTGLGIQGGYTVGGFGGAALTFKVDTLPFLMLRTTSSTLPTYFPFIVYNFLPFVFCHSL